MEQLAKQSADINSFGRSQTVIATSMDMSVKENRVKMLNAMQDCDAKLTENVNIPIQVVDYVAHDIDITSKETGEVARCTRMVLLDKEGATYQCVSETLLKSLQTVCFAYGPPPWSPPLTLTVKTRKNGERSIYWFDVRES